MKPAVDAFRELFMCKAIFFIDMVHDKVKARLVIAFCLLFYLYVTIVYFLQSDAPPNSYPSTIQLLLPASEIMEVGELFERYPIVKVEDQYLEPYEKANVTFILFKQNEDSSNYLFNCDIDFFKEFIWTTSYIRAMNPCSLEIQNREKMTDVGGYAKFEDLKFQKGSEGYYIYTFQVNKNVKVPYQYLFLVSPVKELIFLTSKPSTVFLGQLLIPQPLIMLRNKFGRPTVNKTVVVFGRSFEDCIEGSPNEYNPMKDKDVVLLGDESKQSNQSGIAEFQNLQIIGSVHKFVYLIFSVDGSGLLVPWAKVPFGLLSDFYKYYIKPIVITYEDDLLQINMIQPPSKSVIDGLEFEEQPQLQVMNEKRIPVSGLVCFGVLKQKSKASTIEPSLQLANGLPLKRLTKPITGKYKNKNECFPWIDKSCFESTQTGKYGISTFEGLGINKYGSLDSSNYLSISFHCGNGISEDFDIDLISDSSFIRILSITPNIESSIFSPNLFDLILRVEDQNKYGVSGKMIKNASILRINNNSSPFSYINLENVNRSRNLKTASSHRSHGIIYNKLEIIQTESTNDCFELHLEIDEISSSKFYCFPLKGINMSYLPFKISLSNNSNLYYFLATNDSIFPYEFNLNNVNFSNIIESPIKLRTLHSNNLEFLLFALKAEPENSNPVDISELFQSRFNNSINETLVLDILKIIYSNNNITEKELKGKFDALGKKYRFLQSFEINQVAKIRYSDDNLNNINKK